MYYLQIIKYLNFKIHYDYVSNNNTKAIDINTAYQNCFLTSTIFSNKTTMSHGQKRKSKEQLKLNKINTKIKSKSRIDFLNNVQKYLFDNEQFVIKMAKMVKIKKVNKKTLEMYEAENEEQLTKSIIDTFSIKSID